MRTSVAAGLFLVLACGSGSVSTLEIGTCFDDTKTQEFEISEIPEINCSEPHDNEVFALAEFPRQGPYPGHDVLNDYAFNQCVVQFEAYVGLSYAESELEVFPIIPTESSWNENDDREIVCALFALDQSKLAGSMRGSAR